MASFLWPAHAQCTSVGSVANDSSLMLRSTSDMTSPLIDIFLRTFCYGYRLLSSKQTQYLQYGASRLFNATRDKPPFRCLLSFSCLPLTGISFPKFSVPVAQYCSISQNTAVMLVMFCIWSMQTNGRRCRIHKPILYITIARLTSQQILSLL